MEFFERENNTKAREREREMIYDLSDIHFVWFKERWCATASGYVFIDRGQGIKVLKLKAGFVCKNPFDSRQGLGQVASTKIEGELFVHIITPRHHNEVYKWVPSS